MRSRELTIELADDVDQSVDGLAEAIGSIDSAQYQSVTVFVYDLRGSADELIAIGEALRALSPLRIVNVIWRFRWAASSHLQPLVSLSQTCEALGLIFRVNILVPLDADYFARPTGESTHVDKMRRISRDLRSQKVSIRWLLQIHSDLLFRIEALYLLARDEGIEPLLVFSQYFGPDSSADTLTPDEQLFAWDFITYRLLEQDRALLSSRQCGYYRMLLERLSGQEAVTSGRFVTELRDIDRKWEVRQIADVSDGLRELALDPSAGNDKPTTRWRDHVAFALDVARVMLDALRAYWQRAFVRAPDIKKIQGDEHFNKVLLIGAYGGEHIGDAAILGGVLLRLHEQFGTTEAVLMTQRKNHTSHLIPMLDVPVEVTVDEYERGPIDHHLKQVDSVVFAGGPLVDIPKQLVRHLYTVSRAHRMGKPFLAEGIGPGPFTRLPSWLTARRMVELAGHIKVRTSDSAQHGVVKGLDVQIGRCPAFDYLESRSDGLTRLPAGERNAIEHFLADTQGRPVIGINIRPIGHLHTIGAPDNDLAGYTRSIEDRFERRMAQGLVEFDRSLSQKPCFIYFPMNAIQFGSSDILSAYRIHRALGPDVDFRVWQADVSLDGVVALLRHVDVAITMRFHATIFALSQGCRVIGVDYRIGKRDKVAELLDDAGHSEDCERIDLLTSEWLAARLTALTGATIRSSKQVG